VAQHDDKKGMLEGMQAGADDYLVKPFDQRELKARLLVGKTKADRGLYAVKQNGRNRVEHVDECGPRCEEGVVSDVV